MGEDIGFRLASTHGCFSDLGCGGGIPVAENLMDQGFHVTGIDSAPTLVALCRARFPEQQWVVSR